MPFRNHRINAALRAQGVNPNNTTFAGTIQNTGTPTSTTPASPYTGLEGFRRWIDAGSPPLTQPQKAAAHLHG